MCCLIREKCEIAFSRSGSGALFINSFKSKTGLKFASFPRVFNPSIPHSLP